MNTNRRNIDQLESNTATTIAKPVGSVSVRGHGQSISMGPKSFFGVYRSTEMVGYASCFVCVREKIFQPLDLHHNLFWP
jgi:hypothetical protein